METGEKKDRRLIDGKGGALVTDRLFDILNVFFSRTFYDKITNDSFLVFCPY